MMEVRGAMGEVIGECDLPDNCRQILLEDPETGHQYQFRCNHVLKEEGGDVSHYAVFALGEGLAELLPGFVKKQ